MLARVKPLISAAVVAFAMSAGQAFAEQYPERPIHVIVATSPGGVSDVFIRSLGEELRKKWGQPLVIENRPGGNFHIAAKACAQAAPDGYTLCVLPAEPLTYNQFLFKNIGFDPDHDLAPITNLFFITQVMAINASLGVNDLSSLAALCKTKPKTLSYSAPGLAQALFVENFNKAEGCDMVRVPFRGGADALNGLLSGTTPTVFLGLGNLLGQIKAGKATPLVVDSEKRSPLLPNTKTLREIGYKGDITRSYFALMAPAHTPAAIITKISDGIGQVYEDHAFIDKNLVQRGLEPAFQKPTDFASFLKEDRAVSGRIVKASGLVPQ
ncbi:MAG TPA: tripartite tricarboxylate transporter substrate binding protein [Pseudolabrys sp.]|nr:tripartite tricarboxylate transporter substrate binding protein [Pseudolabrys sp.]